MTTLKSPPTISVGNALQRSPQLAVTLGTPEFKAFLQNVTDPYLHWDEFFRRPMPGGLKPDDLWAYVRQIRESNFSAAPFSDKHGYPFSYWLTASLQRSLLELDRQLGQAGEWTPTGNAFYGAPSLMDEAISSSQLEGAAVTRDGAREMLHSGRRPRDKSEQMIWNNWRTISRLRGMLEEPLAPVHLRVIHGLMTRDTLDDSAFVGRLRTHDDVAIADQRTGEIIHQPPSHETLPARLQAFCDFANDDETVALHPLIKASMLHFWMGYDHPFVDGNGRTARAIFYWYLLSRGYRLFEFLPISPYVQKAPVQYAHAFQKTETDGGDLTYFLLFNVRIVSQALSDVRTYIERQKEQRMRDEKLMEQIARASNINVRQQTLLVQALNTPKTIFTVADHKNSSQIAYGTARSDLLELAARGYLEQKKRGKAFVFVPALDLKERLS